jgi:phosphatidylglycerol:prolipoprotein diacylglycerol transferase
MLEPIIFSFGPFTVRWYGVLIAAAMVIGVFLALREAKRRDWNEDNFLNMALALLPVSILGARIYYVLFNWSYYAANPSEIIAIWHGGLAIHGAIIAGMLVIWFFSRYYGFGFGNTLDSVAPSVVLGQAIGRWGNFFNQEAYGYEVDPAKIPWAMFIDGAYRHPTFLYESIWDLLVFILLLVIRRRHNLLPGDVALTYIIFYSAGRFVIEGFRTDSLMLFGFLRAAQVVSLIAGLGSIVIMWYRHRHNMTGGRSRSIR